MAVLKPPAKGNRIAYDSEVSGFGVRVTAKGAKSFVLNYRTQAGRERRCTIGEWPIWTVPVARDEAKALKRRIRQGEDPLGELQEARAAPTVKDLCQRYAEEHAPKKRTGDLDLWMIDRFILKRLGNLKVEAVTLGDIDRLHRSLADKPYRANRLLALLSTMFSFAIKWGWRSDNPCRFVQRYEEQKRERYLSQAEMARLSEALADYWNPIAANAIRMLLLTGARRGEVQSMRWVDVDLEAGVWTKPSAHVKTKKIHRVPLSAPALEILSGMERRGAYVFPGLVGERCDLKNAWITIRKAAGLEDVRLHDLRHSYASILVSAGLSLPIIGRLLGHTKTETTARYAHWAQMSLTRLKPYNTMQGSTQSRFCSLHDHPTSAASDDIPAPG